MFSFRNYRLNTLKRIRFPLILRSKSDEPNKLIEKNQSSNSNLEKISINDFSLWKSSETNPLIDYLSMRIQKSGPITVADFVRESFSNRKFGFYGHHEQFKRKDDQIQTDSVRRLFAQSIFDWIIRQHENVGNQAIQFVELGPGTGRLTKLLTEMFYQENRKDFQTFFALYEPNPLMRRRQAETILKRSFDPLIFSDYRIKPGNYSLIWIDELKQLLHQDTYFISFEHFSSYPVHKFHKTKNGWKEVMVDWNPLTKRLQYVLASKPTVMARLYENFFNGLENRNHIEISPGRGKFMEAISKHVSLHGGSILIGDFAQLTNNDDSFRAFRQDQLVDPLSDPGNVEIVSDVDFNEIVDRANFSSNLQFFGPIPQSSFLYNTGMHKRLDNLVENKSREEEDEIFEDVERLVSSEYQGERIFYICAQPSDKLHAPIGFSSVH